MAKVRGEEYFPKLSKILSETLNKKKEQKKNIQPPESDERVLDADAGTVASLATSRVGVTGPLGRSVVIGRLSVDVRAVIFCEGTFGTAVFHDPRTVM